LRIIHLISYEEYFRLFITYEAQIHIGNIVLMLSKLWSANRIVVSGNSVDLDYNQLSGKKGRTIFGRKAR